ncbi:MAG: DUF4270 family protein [Mucilaginibacter polytrichastri]|nr:DUF4270 family protein [Mucilaginibacter polytrichastri]
MNFRELGLLTLLISLFSFGGCKSENVGLGADGDAAIKGQLIDTLTVLARTVPEDTIAARFFLQNVINQVPLGYMNDPEVGKTTAEMAVAVHRTDTAGYNQLRQSGIIDSAVLVLKYDTTASLTYGDTTNSRFRLNVYQLSERISGSPLITKKWNHSTEVIGTLNYVPRRKTNVGLATDTVLPHLRVPMNAAFISSRIKSAPASAITTDAAFLNYFKGLYVGIDGAQSTGTGGYSYFDMTTGGGLQTGSETSTSTVRPAFGSALVVYYHTGSDTTSSVFPIGGTFTERTASAITHDISGTPLETQLAAGGSDFPVTYVSGMGGARTRVSIPYLKNLKAQLGDRAVINNAELEVVPVQESSSLPFRPATRINLYQLDIAGQRRLLQDATGSNDARAQASPLLFGGFYGAPNANAYRFTATAWVQDILSGKGTNYGTFISVGNPTNFSTTTGAELSPTLISPGRAVLGGGSNGSYKMKLRVYYSRLD